jgi:hypothetical protein
VTRRASASGVLRLAALALVFFIALALRRGEQLTDPQVWNEEGAVMIPDLVNHGLGTIWQPTNGYITLVPRLIAALALAISPSHYPLIATVVTWLFIIGVLLVVATAPLLVRGGPLLALAVLFVPSDPEVFGLTLYTLWWAGLLVVAAALWQRRSGALLGRIGLVVFGGLSVPVIFIALPVFVYRAIVFRELRTERVVALAAGACAAIQAAVLIRTSTPSGNPPNVTTLWRAIPAFLGNDVVGAVVRAVPDAHLALLTAAGLMTLAAVVAAFVFEREAAATLVVVAFLWAGSIALSAARIDVSILDPVAAGPRYFFYPFIFEAWFFIHLAFVARRIPLRAAAIVFVATAMLSGIPVLRRTHDDLRWSENFASCLTQPDRKAWTFPIEFDGHAQSAWHFVLTGAQCRSLLAHDLLAWIRPLPPAPRSDSVRRANERRQAP